MKYEVFTNTKKNIKTMSKKLYTLLAALVITASTFAQAPEKMSYQAIVRDSGDNLVINQLVGMQISILQYTASGTAVYVETQTPTTNVNGLVTLEIGTGSVVSGDFTTIDWSADSYFIKTETDPTGGTSYTITGTSQLLSVPYALQAKNATTADNGIPSGGTVGQVLTINDNGLPEWIDNVLAIAYRDSDNDGFGNPNIKILFVSGEIPPIGFVTNSNDCDDTDINEFPGQTWYIDTDGDGYGASSEVSCERPSDGYILSELSSIGSGTDDCDDTNPNQINREILGDGLDNNCDGLVDEPNIGQIIDGGIVFYVAPTPIDLDGDGTLDTGLVCAFQASFVQWGCTGIDLPSVPNVTSGPSGLGAEIGDGMSNTDAILNDCPTAPAALAARSLGNEWFLPSMKELNEVYLNKDLLESVTGNSFISLYWSSTESNNSDAWGQNIQGGNQFTINKDYTNTPFYVFAVRAF
jgi:hypothetical protein